MKKITQAFLAAALMMICYTNRTNAQALNFGAYSFIDIGNDILPNNQSYTKEAWIRVYYYVNFHGCNILSAFDHPFWLENGVLCAANNYGDSAKITVQDPAGQIGLNTWIHVAVTYDAASTTMKLYKNGTLIATNTNAPSYITSDLNIGAQEFGDFFDGGDIDEVRLWNVARTQSQIQGAMNTDVAQNSNLVAYYRFNQGTPGGDNTSLTSAYDYSGNTHCGTLYNFNLTGSSSNYITGAIGTTNSITVATSAPGTIAGSSSVCEGGTITMSNSVAGGLWGVNEIDTASISTSGVVTGNYAGTVTISYKTCGGSATKDITVNPSPVISATASNGSITASATGGTASYTYAWSNGATGATVSNLSTGNYSVTVTDSKGCKDTGTYFVTGSVILTNSISVALSSTCYTGSDKHTIYLGYGAKSATLTSNPTGATSFTYSWTPGTYLSSTNSKSVTFTPTQPGTYTYTCTATNSGHSVAATVTMVVIDAVDHKHNGCVYTTHYSSCNSGHGDTKSCKTSCVDKQLRNNHSDRLGCNGSHKDNRPADIKGMTIVGNDLVVSTYPNPFTSGISVKLENSVAEYADVVLYDINGKVADSKMHQAADAVIVAGSNLQNGIYIMEISNGSQVKRMQVVKTK